MKRWLLAAVAFCALTSSVSAQVPLPPPTAAPTLSPSPTEQAASVTPSFTAPANEASAPDAIIDFSVASEPLDVVVAADVLFPAGIAFQVRFRTPEVGVNSITMTAEQAGWDGQTIDIDLAVAVSNDGGLSTVDYLWNIGENAPRLFEPMTVAWTITPRGGRSEVVETELVFADSRVSWTILETGGIPARFAASDSRTNAAVISAQLSSLSALLDAGGREILPVKVVVFPPGIAIDPCTSDDAVAGMNTPLKALCDSKSAMSRYADQGWDVAAVTSAGSSPTIVADAIARAAYPALFASEDVPEWFKTGLIAYLAGAFSANELEIARSGSRNNSLLLSLDIVPSDAEIHLWRAQSLGALVYMASQIGVAPMLDMLSQLDNGESLDDIWLDRTGQTLNVLTISWRNWIFSPRAEAAYNSLPNLAPTVTLVPTRTASYTPTPTSTFTPSATWTNTLTPSITPTMTPSVSSGFEQPTAAPTSTPTATLHPTITPRPAVAFSLDDAPEEPLFPFDRSLSVVAAAAVLVIVLSGAFLVLSRRRK